MRLGQTACKEAHRVLSQKLTGALVDGETVCFEDEGALSAYTLKRLRPRCRALFEVLLAENSSEVLSCLLRNCQAAMQQGRELRVASLGGGPAFDLVALLATMEALSEAASQEPAVKSLEGCYLPSRCGVRCTVLDLAPAWAAAVSSVAEVSSEIWSQQEPQFVELLAPVDLRCPDSPEILHVVRQADVVIASYVLHENEATILSEDGLQGAFPQIFHDVQVGVPLIFLDATHRLWPVLLKTAEAVMAGDGQSLAAILPEGLASHVHAALLLKSTETLHGDYGSRIEAFAAHQLANQVRLQKLQEKGSAVRSE